MNKKTVLGLAFIIALVSSKNTCSMQLGARQLQKDIQFISNLMIMNESKFDEAQKTGDTQTAEYHKSQCTALLELLKNKQKQLNPYGLL